MICQNCHQKISDGVKFCKFCGHQNNIVKTKEEGSVDLYFNKRNNSCHLCGTYAPLKYVEFNQNIGMLIMRDYKQLKGNLCKNCINKTYWKFTLITLSVGWLGVISLLVAPYFIISNTIYYLGSLGLPSPDNKS